MNQPTNKTNALTDRFVRVVGENLTPRDLLARLENLVRNNLVNCLSNPDYDELGAKGVPSVSMPITNARFQIDTLLRFARFKDGNSATYDLGIYELPIQGQENPAVIAAFARTEAGKVMSERKENVLAFNDLSVQEAVDTTKMLFDQNQICAMGVTSYGDMESGAESSGTVAGLVGYPDASPHQCIEMFSRLCEENYGEQAKGGRIDIFLHPIPFATDNIKEHMVPGKGRAAMWVLNDKNY